METHSEQIKSIALDTADTHRQIISPTLDTKRRSALGQFMTPKPVAKFMASKFSKMPECVRLLDAGAGVGALTAAFVAEACFRKDKPKEISVTAYEVDRELAIFLRETLRKCALECETAGIQFASKVIEDDYILRSAEPLWAEQNSFNCAILNPPYTKIRSNSKWRKALSSIGIETVNLYSAFVAVALQQLSDKGELVAITPRSFCNGSYYQPFRKQLIASSALLSFHVFGSRRSAFKDDDVLQENVIYHLRKGNNQPNRVHISTSQGPEDETIHSNRVFFSDIVRPSDPHLFFRLAISVEETDLAARIQALPCMLGDLNIKVSTGRVVDFRAKDHLRKMPDDETVPLIYPVHFDNGMIRWPVPEFKKHNAIANNEETQTLMVPEGIYVLTKRFSAKEEKRRLVSVIYDPSQVGKGVVGFENHLNYFHENGSGLSMELAWGLAIFLNSTAADQYFRQFSGHTQVNATDLRNMHYPDRDQLEALGKNNLHTQHDIDAAVEVLL